MHDSDFFNKDTEKIEVGRQAIRGGVVLIIGQGIQLFLSMASTIILARLLMPDDFGLLAMVLPVIGFVGLFRDSGLQLATIQQQSINHKQISTLFWINVAIGFSLMIVLGSISNIIAKFYGRAELVLITLAYSINLLISSFGVQHTALLRRQLAFKKLVVIGVVSQFVSVLFGILGANLGMGYWVLVFMANVATLMELILTLSFCKWMPGWPSRGTGVRKMLAFGGGMTISSIFYFVMQSIDNILIGRILGGLQLGQYDRAKQLFMMPLLQLMAPLDKVAIPSLSRLIDSPELYRKSYLRIQEKLLIVTAAFCGYLMVYGEAVIELLLGPEWPLAGSLLQIFAFGGLILPVSFSVGWLLTTQSRASDLAAWSPIGLLLRCSAIGVGYSFGIMGIALSIAAFQYISFFVFSIWVGRKGPVSTIMIWKNMLPTLAAATVATCFIYYTKDALVNNFHIFSIGLGAIAYYMVFFSVLWLIPSGKASLLDIGKLTKMAMLKI